MLICSLEIQYKNSCFNFITRIMCFFSSFDYTYKPVEFVISDAFINSSAFAFEYKMINDLINLFQSSKNIIREVVISCSAQTNRKR